MFTRSLVLTILLGTTACAAQPLSRPQPTSFACAVGENMSYDARPDVGHIELTVVDGTNKNGLVAATIAEGRLPFAYGPELYEAALHHRVDLSKKAGVAIFHFRNVDLPASVPYVVAHAKCAGMAPVVADANAPGWVMVRVPLRAHVSLLVLDSTLARTQGKHPLACVTTEFADGTSLDFIPSLVGYAPRWPANTTCAPPGSDGETLLSTLRPGHQAYRFLVITKSGSKAP